MTYDEFVYENRNKLVGYLILSNFSNNPDLLDAPRPQDSLLDDALEKLKYQLSRCMPLDSMIVDLRDWDVRFEDALEDDWYFSAVFGVASSLEHCAEQLAEFFMQQYSEHGLDYDQSSEDPAFESLVLEQARNFISSWRSNVFARHANPRAPKDEPSSAIA